MTLKIRVEKADATDWVAEVHEEYFDLATAKWQRVDKDMNIPNQDKLSWPAEHKEYTIWGGKRLVIEEGGSNDYVYSKREENRKWVDRAIEAERAVAELEKYIKDMEKK